MYLGIKTQTVYFNFTYGKILLNMRLKLESALLVSAPRPPPPPANSQKQNPKNLDALCQNLY